MSGARSRARGQALQALYQWQLTAQPPHDIGRLFLRDPESTGGVDEAYFAELIREVPAHVEELDGLLGAHLDRAIGEVDPVERAILRIGAYELCYRLEIGPRIVLNEAVELAKCYGGEAGHKFVNAVLDGMAKVVRAPGGRR